jgi:hypothetical protein
MLFRPNTTVYNSQGPLVRTAREDPYTFSVTYILVQAYLQTKERLWRSWLARRSHNTSGYDQSSIGA